nr:uncharacterized protein LOC111992959 [Quercus suber]
MDPLKYLFKKSTLSGRLSRWLILLAKFDLKYMARKTIKGSVVSNFYAENPIEEEVCKEDFPNEDILDVELGTWMMYFDRAVNQYGNRIGVLLITPKRSHIHLELTKTFDKIEYTVIPGAQNQFADILATLASVVEIPEGVWKQPLEIEQSYEEAHKWKTEASVMTIEEEEAPWYYDMKFLELGAYPNVASKRECRSIRMMATQYILCGGQLYRRSYDGIHLCCLKKEEAERTHANLNHIPPTELYSMTSQWPFLFWGIDVIGRITPKASNGHEYILIISDNGSHFEGEVRRVMEKYGIEHYKSSLYQPEANEAIEATNKNVKNILAKMRWAIQCELVTYGTDLDLEKFPLVRANLEGLSFDEVRLPPLMILELEVFSTIVSGITQPLEGASLRALYLAERRGGIPYTEWLLDGLDYEEFNSARLIPSLIVSPTIQKHEELVLLAGNLKPEVTEYSRSLYGPEGLACPGNDDDDDGDEDSKSFWV